MLDGFPEAPPVETGELDIHALIRIYKHLISCAQSHDTPFDPMKYLCVCVPPNLYANHTSAAYPIHPENPGVNADYAGDSNDTERATTLALWEHDNMIYTDIRTMSNALIHRFLSLLRSDDKEEYEEHHITNPNETFQECFQWFVDNFGDTDEPERERNRERMKKPWAMQDGWIRLTSQIESGRNYAHFCGKPISESDILDIAMTHILNTQLFAFEYAEWKGFPPQYKNWTNFKRHWKSKMTLKKTTTKTTSSEMGLSASGATTADDGAYDESMKQFSTAYSATQGSIQNLTNTTVNMLPAIMQELQLQRQQKQMMAQAINMGTANQWSNNGGGGNYGGGGGRNKNQRGK